MKRFTKRNDFSEQFRRYRETFGWFFRDFMSLVRARAVATLILNVVGTALQGLALALAMTFFKYLESGESPIKLPTFVSDNPEAVFFALSTAVFVALGISALLIFLSNQISNNLAVSYAKETIKRILLKEPDALSKMTPSPGKLMPAEMYYLMVRGRRLVLLSRIIPKATIPAARIVFSFAALLFIHPLLTLTLMAGMAVSFPVIYLINFNAVQNEKSMRRMQGAARRSLFRTGDAMSSAPRASHDLLESLESLFATGLVDESMRAMLRRYAAVAKSAFVSNLMLAFVALAVILFLGLGALQGDFSWTMVITYLVLLQIAMTGKRSMLMVFSQLTKFYGDLRLIHGLLSRHEDNVDISGNLPVPMAKVKKRNIHFSDVAGLKIHAGTPVGIYSNVMLSRYNLFHFCLSISGFNADTAIRYQRASLIVGTEHQATSGYVPRVPDANEYELLFEALAGKEERSSEWLAAARRLSQYCCGATSANDIAANNRARIRYELLEAASSDRSIVWIAFDALCELSDDERRDWMLLLAGKYVLVCLTNDVLSSIAVTVENVILLDVEKCIGIVGVETFVSRADEIRRAVYGRKAKDLVGESDGDEEELDMDDLF